MVEGEPLLNFESEDNEEVLKDEHEFVGEEKKHELIIETGHIAVNPLQDDHTFATTDDDEEEDT